MKAGYLSQHFRAIGAKRLSAVEANKKVSNQHELNGTKPLRQVLGDCGEPVQFKTLFLWFGEENEGISGEGFVTWYDSRRDDPTRSAECRLYYSTTDVSELAKEGDMVFVGMRTDGTVMMIITANGSTIENQLFWLLNIEDQNPSKFQIKNIDESDTKVDFVVRFILEELGIETEEPETDKLDGILEPYIGKDWPTTDEFSKLARKTAKISSLDDPDLALMMWLEQEVKLFKRFERFEVEARLNTGFTSKAGADVDGFISYSLSVQNRRKSRAGSALENHLEHIFDEHKLLFRRGVYTEKKSKPDFLFPGHKYYHDTNFPAEFLTMLASKTTCKERWRQVLAEANRIEKKHLLTIEPAISTPYTDQMQEWKVQLVLPQAIHQTYEADQQKWLMNVKAFINYVQERQHTVGLG